MGVTYDKERDFEDALVKTLVESKGWCGGVLESPSEKDLIENWCNILYENNKDIDTLNGCSLTDSEMRQVLDQVNQHKTPAQINAFINGSSVPIRRDNPDDTLHFGKTVSLRIYSRDEIAGGRSCYQIARQPRFSSQSAVRNPSRGDLMLLINGMPVIHVELKRSGVPVSKAANQIATYAAEGAFTGIFSMVQVFVAMQPDDAVYFANPGPGKRFSPEYQFHWADERNVPYKNWRDIAERLLSIPMAHMLVGFYSVADASDGMLKVMRSYQYYAASAMLNRVISPGAWEGGRIPRGGYIWHTTGSGKTLTSFKAAQLLSTAGRADKVVFLLDRIELSTQSFKNYKAFADESDTVRETENAGILKEYLKSDESSETLIVTSIQKMGFMDEESDRSLITAPELEKINKKKLVFVVDECHRSTFGKLMGVIKGNFPNAVLFGFTGTPIKAENAKKGTTTSDIFGDALHTYTLANGINDGNVLGFDLNKQATYSDYDLRRAVALEKAKAADENEVFEDERKTEVFNHWMRDVPMAADEGPSIEGCLKPSMYDRDEHRRAVVDNIKQVWGAVSQGGKLHALLATSSIKEAIEYYRLLKECAPELNVTAVFDDSDPTCADAVFKRQGLDEITEDYNDKYGFHFSSGSPAMKSDICDRLAHKGKYKAVERGEQIDILIVVNQMLTGYDSIWLGTLFLDKMLEYEHVIQAFSRTNRVNAETVKPFGSIFYYRKPHTMELNIARAVEMYSDGEDLSLFVDKLDANIEAINSSLEVIRSIYTAEGLDDFNKLPDDEAACAMFASEFRKLNDSLEAAKIQGFTFSKATYTVPKPDGTTVEVTCELDSDTYSTLLARYCDLAEGGPGEPGSNPDIPYDIDAHIVALGTERIDAAYMQSRFIRWVEAKDIPVEGQRALDELHSQFSKLSARDQVFAEKVVFDIQNGNLEVVEGKDFLQYIMEYRKGTEEGYLDDMVAALGVDREQLKEIVALRPSERDLDAHGRWANLQATIDKGVAKAFFEERLGTPMRQKDVNREARTLLRRFVLSGGFDIMAGDDK